MYAHVFFLVDVPNIDEAVRQTNIQLQSENRNLQALNTALHEKYHAISLKLAELQDALTAKETEIAELKNQIDDQQYELEKVRSRNDKLENHLAEAIEKLKTYHELHGDAQKGTQSNNKQQVVQSGVSQAKLEDLTKEVEEWRELANNRLQELDKLHQQHRETLKEVEKLKMDVSALYRGCFNLCFYLKYLGTLTEFSHLIFRIRTSGVKMFFTMAFLRFHR